MADEFETLSPGLSSPASKAVSITPDDATDLTITTRALLVGGAGDVSVILAGDSAPVTLAGLLAGTVYPLRITRVRATGTTATNLVALS